MHVNIILQDIIERHRRASKRGEIQFYHVGLTGSTEQNATTAHLYSLTVLYEVHDQEVKQYIFNVLVDFFL